MAKLPDISIHFPTEQGFCHPDWEAISEVIETNLQESEWNAAWLLVSRHWLGQIRNTLGGDYQIHETPNFMILSEAPPRVIKDACQSFENSLKRILSGLEGVASDEGYSKHVVMMFASMDDYYDYITYFYPEGEHPMSGGVCLGGEGYVHFAFPTTDYSFYRTVLVHELTHGCLGHLPIPTWVNEALAMRMEQSICGSDIFHMDKEIYEKHCAHWNAVTIQQFWTGESWSLPGESFELSYDLAQILWRKIEVVLEATRAEIFQFIKDAHHNDAGEAACKSIFELSLGELVSDFLGDGKWTPEPSKWPDKSTSLPSAN